MAITVGRKTLSGTVNFEDWKVENHAGFFVRIAFLGLQNGHFRIKKEEGRRFLVADFHPKHNSLHGHGFDICEKFTTYEELEQVILRRLKDQIEHEVKERTWLLEELENLK